MADQSGPRRTETAAPRGENKSLAEKATRKKELDTARGKRRVNIGSAFEQWRQLMKLQPELKSDEMVAEFLLESYGNTTSTPVKRGFKRPPPPPLSTIAESFSEREEDFSVYGVEGLDSCSAETSLLTIQASVTSADERLGDINEDAFNDITNSIIDYDEDEYDPSWHPDMEAQSELLLEEDTVEEDSDCNDSDDPDYVSLFRVCKGRSLNTGFILEECPSVTMEDTVHDAGDDTDQDDHEEHLSVLEQEQETQHLPQKKQRRQPYRSEITVEVEDDIIGKPASIAYHDCLRQLCEFVALPIDSCKGKDPITQKQCQAKGPFEINIKSRVTEL
ncbi:unnamed protein product [Arctogadus glacialis]